STVRFVGASASSTIDGGASAFNDVSFEKSAGHDVVVVGIMNVLGSLAIAQEPSNGSEILGTAVAVHGDVTMVSGDGGTATIGMVGASNAVLSGPVSYGGSGTQQFPSVAFNKS